MTTTTRKTQLYTILILFVLVSVAAAQQGMSNARSVAMGSAYTAIARGIESPSWNPANLGLTARRAYRFNLISVGFGISNNSFSKEQYDLYNGRHLSEQDKQDILGRIPSEGLAFDLDTEVQALGFSFGTFAFTASALGASNFSVSKDIAELVLNGNEFGRMYEIGDTEGEGFGVSSFGVSTAFRLDIPGVREFAIGVSAKYLRGLAYAKVVEATSSITTDIDGLHSNGRVAIDRSYGGNGYAFDLGAAAKLSRRWSMSLGVSNVVSEINWTRETKRFTYTFRADSLSAERIQSSDIDSVFIDSDKTVDIDPFTTKIGPELHFGIARSTKRFTLGFDLSRGLVEKVGVSTKPRIAVGTELRLIPFLPMRAGTYTGGRDGFSTSAGFGLDFAIFSWDFAILSRNGAFNGKGLGVAFDWMFRF